MAERIKTINQRRVFSDPLKRKLVKDIETGKASVMSVCRAYDVSRAAVYKWIGKYSRYLQSGIKLVVEMESESYKTRELEARVKELEAALGRKQMELDFLNKMIEIGKDELGIDLKKKFATPPSTGSDPTKSDTGTDSKTSAK